jgi:hypothetical protein
MCGGEVVHVKTLTASCGFPVVLLSTPGRSTHMRNLAAECLGCFFAVALLLSVGIAGLENHWFLPRSGSNAEHEKQDGQSISNSSFHSDTSGCNSVETRDMLAFGLCANVRDDPDVKKTTAVVVLCLIARPFQAAIALPLSKPL